MASEYESDKPEDEQIAEASKDEQVEGEQAEEQVAQWYTVKVQVNREDRVQRELQRRISIFHLDKYFEEILVPIQRVAEIKNGRKRETKVKLYPGYILVKMIINDETWFLMRETPGVGDFAGSDGKPLPMTQADIDRILNLGKEASEEQPTLAIPYRAGDRVKIVDGSFKDIEGEVSEIDAVAGRATVNISIFGRNTPVELEYWQIEKIEA